MLLTVFRLHNHYSIAVLTVGAPGATSGLGNQAAWDTKLGNGDRCQMNRKWSFCQTSRWSRKIWSLSFSDWNIRHPCHSRSLSTGWETFRERAQKNTDVSRKPHLLLFLLPHANLIVEFCRQDFRYIYNRNIKLWKSSSTLFPYPYLGYLRGGSCTVIGTKGPVVRAPQLTTISWRYFVGSLFIWSQFFKTCVTCHNRTVSGIPSNRRSTSDGGL